MKVIRQNPKLFTKNLLKLEKSGRYEEARNELKDVWEDTNQLPNTEGLSSKDAAEVILRCGSLIGFLGHIKQLENSQEKSKNLLTKARKKFLDIYDQEKITECECYLALAYWRTGEISEAENWIEEAHTHKLPKTSKVRIYLLMVEIIIDFPKRKYKNTLSKLIEAESDVLKYGDDNVKGDFFNHYGLVLKNLGKNSEALSKFKLAKKFHHSSGHKIYLATIENNLAQLYRLENLFTESHEAVDNAIKIYEEISDRTRKGSSLDTKASIYLDEGKYDQALLIIEESIRILKNSENAAYIVESILTKSKTLVCLDEIGAASICLSEGIQIAKMQIGEEAANNLAKEFEIIIRKQTMLPNKKEFVEKKSENRDLELVLPSELSNYKSYQAIRIKNNHLANIGLQKGSLAIVVKEEIENGDLIAITEIANDSIICGFYDSYFGMVALNGINDDPILYKMEEVKLLGKIVGFGNPSESSTNKVLINSINR